jgi:hypothetical protein
MMQDSNTPEKTTEIVLAVTIDGQEVFRVASDGCGIMPGDEDRDMVLRALTRGLAVMLGTELTDEPPQVDVRFNAGYP